MVLVFDGDEAGQSAADRALEFFLGSELDLRVLTLPANLDPCDFLLKEGADAFRALVEQAVEPLAYLLARAAVRFDLDSIEGSRRAAEWVLGIMSRVPETHQLGLEVKQAKVLDTLVASAARSARNAQRHAPAVAAAGVRSRAPAGGLRLPGTVASGLARPRSDLRLGGRARPRSGRASSIATTWS